MLIRNPDLRIRTTLLNGPLGFCAALPGNMLRNIPKDEARNARGDSRFIAARLWF
jgi:hypothetical protein